jgi:hypothetical protein
MNQSQANRNPEIESLNAAHIMGIDSFHSMNVKFCGIVQKRNSCN